MVGVLLDVPGSTLGTQGQLTPCAHVRRHGCGFADGAMHKHRIPRRRSRAHYEAFLPPRIFFSRWSRMLWNRDDTVTCKGLDPGALKINTRHTLTLGEVDLLRSRA